MWPGRQCGRKRGDVCFFYNGPAGERRRLEALIHAKMIIRSDRSLWETSQKAQTDEIKGATRTNFNPNWWGANSTARTLPFASANTARSTQRVPGPLATAEPPFACGWSALSAGISSHIFTVRSKEELARTDPNSGCAHESFVTAAS